MFEIAVIIWLVLLIVWVICLTHTRPIIEPYPTGSKIFWKGIIAEIVGRYYAPQLLSDYVYKVVTPNSGTFTVPVEHKDIRLVQ